MYNYQAMTLSASILAQHLLANPKCNLKFSSFDNELCLHYTMSIGFSHYNAPHHFLLYPICGNETFLSFPKTSSLLSPLIHCNSLMYALRIFVYPLCSEFHYSQNSYHCASLLRHWISAASPQLH